MKNRYFAFVIAFVALSIFALGCGGSPAETSPTDVDEKKPVSEKKLPKLPIEGFVGKLNLENNTFVLATLPQYEGQKPGETNVIISDDAEIVDVNGNKTELKNYDRVRIDKGDVSDSITASKITLTKSSAKIELAEKFSEKLATSNNTEYLKVPDVLKSSLLSDLPKSFPDGTWTVQLPENHPTIMGAKIIELTSGNWSIYLLDNPETDEKYSVTITDRSEFEWTGSISVDNIVAPR